MKPIALIVEDRPEMARLWETNLHPLDLDIRVADSLERALSIMGGVPPPDLLLLDLRLTDSDEVNTVAHIQKFKKLNPLVIIIVISGFATPDIATAAIAQGASSVINKLEMQKQVTLWREIEAALDQIPQDSAAHKIFGYTSALLTHFTKRFTA